MIKKQTGFTMVELLITMVIFVLTIAAASSIFVPLLAQFKQQSRVTETQIEGIVGLDVLRRDIEQSGFGLPWIIPAAVNYQEATTAGTTTYNDSPGNAPRALVSGDGAGMNGSDYLVVKATSVAINDAATKWSYVVGEAGGGRSVKSWGKAAEDLNDGDSVIVLIPSRGEANQRILVDSGGSFSVSFNGAAFPAAYSPSTERDLYLIYGVDPNTALRMPFNRADFYVANTGVTIPSRCASSTGILMNSLINQTNGVREVGMPLLDCVADMQVIFRLDSDGDGDIDSDTAVLNDASGAALTAQQIREQVKEVRVYILAHEGQIDRSFRYCPDPPACASASVAVGEFGLGSTFDFGARGVTDWRNYRWKVYRIVVKPNNLRG